MGWPTETWAVPPAPAPGPAGVGTRETPPGGQEQVERDDKRKKKNMAAADNASTSIGTVTTTPFAGGKVFDDIAMPI